MPPPAPADFQKLRTMKTMKKKKRRASRLVKSCNQSPELTLMEANGFDQPKLAQKEVQPGTKIALRGPKSNKVAPLPLKTAQTVAMEELLDPLKYVGPKTRPVVVTAPKFAKTGLK